MIIHCMYILWFVHLSKDIWVASTYWLLGTVLLWTLVCNYLFETLFLILSGLYPELELVEHSNSILSFWETVILFSKVAVPFYILIRTCFSRELEISYSIKQIVNSCERPVSRINGVWEKGESLPSLVVSWCQAGHHRFAPNGWSGTEHLGMSPSKVTFAPD